MDYLRIIHYLIVINEIIKFKLDSFMENLLLSFSLYVKILAREGNILCCLEVTPLMLSVKVI